MSSYSESGEFRNIETMDQAVVELKQILDNMQDVISWEKDDIEGMMSDLDNDFTSMSQLLNRMNQIYMRLESVTNERSVRRV